MTKDQKIEAAAKSQVMLDRALSRGSSMVYNTKKYTELKDKIRACYGPLVMLNSVFGIMSDEVILFREEMESLANQDNKLPDPIGVYNYSENYIKEMGL